MKKLFLQNCISKKEFDKILLINPAYFDELEIEIIKTINLRAETYNILINNLRNKYDFLKKYKQISHIDDNIAKTILIKKENSSEKIYIVLNGREYPRFVSF